MTAGGRLVREFLWTNQFYPVDIITPSFSMLRVVAAFSLAVMLEALKSVNFQETTRRNNPETDIFSYEGSLNTEKKLLGICSV
jgi:hypothetical protein